MIGIWQHQSLYIDTSTTIIHCIYHPLQRLGLYQQMMVMEHTHPYQNILQVHPTIVLACEVKEAAGVTRVDNLYYGTGNFGRKFT